MTEASKRGLLESAVALSAVQFSTFLLPLATVPYLARVLGADQLGRMAFALSVGQIATVLTDYGFNLSACRAVAVNRHDPARIAEIWSAVSLIRSALAVASLLVVLLIAAALPHFRAELGLFVVASAPIAADLIFPQWLFQGLQRLKLVSAMQIAGRVIAAGAVFVFVRSGADLGWAVFLQSAGPLIGGLIALPSTLRVLGASPPSWPSGLQLRTQLADGWHFFASNAAVTVYTTGNTFILGLFAAPAALAQFHVAEKFVKAANALYTPIASAVFPYASALAATSRPKFAGFSRHMLALVALGAGVLSIAIYFSAEPVVALLFGPQYVQAASLLKIFSVLPLLVMSSNVLGIQTMLPLGLERQFSRVLGFAALADFAVFIPAVARFGATGAAWANVAVEALVVACMAAVLYARRRIAPTMARPDTNETLTQ